MPARREDFFCFPYKFEALAADALAGITSTNVARSAIRSFHDARRYSGGVWTSMVENQVQKHALNRQGMKRGRRQASGISGRP